MKMVTKTQLVKNQETHKYNTSRMHQVIDLVLHKIIKQGGGCFNDMGSAYYDKVTKNKDVIAHLSTIPVQFLMRHFRTIDSDECKPIFKNVCRVHQFDVIRDIEQSRVKMFLQELQNIHDDSFDPFNKVDDRMDTFKSKMKQLKESL